MVRKLADYLADDAKRASDERDLVSRSEVRREQQQLESRLLAVAKALAELKPSRLEPFGLGEPLLEILAEIRVIESAPARMRALKRLRAGLRDLDLDGLEQKLEALSAPGRRSAPSPVDNWCDRLSAGLDVELSAFLEQFPTGDRSQLRTLARNLAHAKEADRARARGKLADAVRRAITQGSASPSSG